jgi:hypothetical protein
MFLVHINLGCTIILFFCILFSSLLLLHFESFLRFDFQFDYSFFFSALDFVKVLFQSYLDNSCIAIVFPCFAEVILSTDKYLEQKERQSLVVNRFVSCYIYDHFA